METASSCQASNFGKHGPRDTIHTRDTQSVQPLAHIGLNDAIKITMNLSMYI